MKKMSGMVTGRVAAPGTNLARGEKKRKALGNKPDKPGGITQLGAMTKAAANPNAAFLETVPNKAGRDFPYVARYTCPEFTSLCPVTGQPDFAHIVIDYVPRLKLVESKSLKLFLQSFRNHGGFHEECTMMIGKRFAEACEPIWIRVAAYWYPRGGIPIDVFWSAGAVPFTKLPVDGSVATGAPQRIHIPALEVPAFRGRG